MGQRFRERLCELIVGSSAHVSMGVLSVHPMLNGEDHLDCLLMGLGLVGVRSTKDEEAVDKTSPARVLVDAGTPYSY
jgi:hypothetical protein